MGTSQPSVQLGGEYLTRDSAVVMTVAVVALDLLASRPGSPAARGGRYSGAIAALAIARVAGVSWAELGLGRREVGSGLRVGALGGACAITAVSAGAAMPATRGYFVDKRGAVPGGCANLVSGLARIAFAEVPPEELTYRSALPALWTGDGWSRASSVALSSVLFGVSHVLPTLSSMGQTALHPRLAHRPLRQVAFVAGNVAVTGIAGAGFAWLRLRSGSVLAPLLVHAALNGSALLASGIVQRPGRETTAPARLDGAPARRLRRPHARLTPVGPPGRSHFGRHRRTG
ncbi:MAG TPA: CPBP family intramembrane glutamic endopeptidase [Streptosporangiaceae bacterium]